MGTTSRGHISAGDLSAFIFYAVLVAGSGGAISETIGDLQRAAGRRSAWPSCRPSRPPLPSRGSPGLWRTPVRGNLQFDSVSFPLSTRPGPWRSIGFRSRRGAGRDGCHRRSLGAGKTTVFNLLLRFYDPEAGIDPLSTASTFAICAFRRSAPHARDRAAGACAVHRVGCRTHPLRTSRRERCRSARRPPRRTSPLAFIEAMPLGFATDLGTRGVRLSAARRQRIAIAGRCCTIPPSCCSTGDQRPRCRAGLPSRPLDRLKCIGAHDPGHRPSSRGGAEKADRIVVIDRGRVVDIGRHADLVRRGVLYAHAWPSCSFAYGRGGEWSIRLPCKPLLQIDTSFLPPLDDGEETEDEGRCLYFSASASSTSTTWPRHLLVPNRGDGAGLVDRGTWHARCPCTCAHRALLDPGAYFSADLAVPRPRTSGKGRTSP